MAFGAKARGDRGLFEGINVTGNGGQNRRVEEESNRPFQRGRGRGLRTHVEDDDVARQVGSTRQREEAKNVGWAALGLCSLRARDGRYWASAQLA